MFSVSYLCLLCGLKLPSANMKGEVFFTSSGFGAFWNCSKSNGGGFLGSLPLLFFFLETGPEGSTDTCFPYGGYN